METKVLGGISLTIATLIWGTSLVAQSMGTNQVGPFTFNAARFLIGTIVLLPFVIFINYHKNKQQASIISQKEKNKKTIQGGMICGLIVFFTAFLQQTGIAYTTVGKAGFITSLYIVIIPIIKIFFKNRISLKTCLCTLFATIGMYLLCVNENTSFGLGDSYVLICAFSTAIHILAIDYYASRVDCIKLSCLQFFMCGALSALAALIIEKPTFQAIFEAGLPILYTGIFSCGVAYTLQAVGQKSTSPIAASLILSLESVFSVLSGWVILGEKLSFREASGCVVMFTAIVAAQLPICKNKKQKHITQKDN